MLASVTKRWFRCRDQRLIWFGSVGLCVGETSCILLLKYHCEETGGSFGNILFKFYYFVFLRTHIHSCKPNALPFLFPKEVRKSFGGFMPPFSPKPHVVVRDYNIDI